MTKIYVGSLLVFVKKNLDPAVVALISGGDPNAGFDVIIGNKTYQTFPFLTPNRTSVIIVKDGDEFYIGHKGTDSYLNTKNTSNNLPNNFRVLLDINYQKDFSESNVKTKIEAATNTTFVDSGKKSMIDLTGTNTGGISWIKACDYILVSKVENFVSVFFQAGDASQIEGFVEDAFVSCPAAYSDYQIGIPNRCLNQCIDPRCVVDYLLNINAGLSDYQKNVLVARYLGETIGITQEEMDWIAFPSNNDILMEVYNGLSSNNLNICEKGDCSLAGSYRAIIKLTRGSTALLSTQNKETLIQTFGELYCNDIQTYHCLSNSESLPLLYATTAFSSIDNETQQRILNAGCSLPELEDVDNFSGLDNPPVNPLEVEEIDNGIDIIEIHGSLVNSCSNSVLIGQNIDRMNTEDLLHGLDGDNTGLWLPNINPSGTLSDEEWFVFMDVLFSDCTVFDSELRTVGEEFIDEFKTNSSASYEHFNVTVNEKAAESNKMKNFIKRFGAELNSDLISLNGDISNSMIFLEENIRPTFNGAYHKFHGLQILVNDTEFTQIYLKNNTYTYDSVTKEWSGWFCFEIEDHFGLDKNDAVTYQLYHAGFPAWWVLQHQRNKVPFHTKILVEAKISGKLLP